MECQDWRWQLSRIRLVIKKEVSGLVAVRIKVNTIHYLVTYKLEIKHLFHLRLDRKTFLFHLC